MQPEFSSKYSGATGSYQVLINTAEKFSEYIKAFTYISIAKAVRAREIKLFIFTAQKTL